MEAKIDIIEMEVRASASSSSDSATSATPIQPPRSKPIDIVTKRDKTVPLPRGPERISFADRWSVSGRRSHSKSTSSSDDDSSSASAKSGQASIRPFTGDDTDRCVEDFIADIDSESSRLAWNGSTTLDKAKSLISGSAASLLVTGGFVGWEGLREALRRQYGHRDSLRHCTRLRGESVAAFRQRITDIAEREAIRVLIRGLSRDIAARVEAARPSSMTEATAMAAFYEAGGYDPELILREAASGPWSSGQDQPLLIGGLTDLPSRENSFLPPDIVMFKRGIF